MDEVSVEELATMTTMGLVGFAIVVVIAIAFYVLSAWLMNVSLGIVGNRKPGIIKCMGWMFLTSVVNMTISALLNQMLGIVGGLIAIPLVIFATIYILSIAGDCDLLKGFLAWMLHCLFSIGAALLLCIALMVPLAVIGSQSDGPGKSWRAMIESAAKQQSVFNPNETMSDDAGSFAPGVRPASLNRSSGDQLPTKMPTVYGKDSDSAKSISTPRRTKDGTNLNPFFSQ